MFAWWIIRVNPRLVLPGLVCVVVLNVPVGWTAGNDSMKVLGKVTPLPVADILVRPASFFDLEGRTITFTPDGEGRYAVQAGSLTWVETGAATDPIFNLSRGGFRGDSTGVSLPFGFPFAGRAWTRVHVNTNGNVSFAAPETTHFEQRSPWASGTMRSVTAAVDSRSAAGLEAMIAVLWALYGETSVSIAASPARVAITWDAVRIVPRNHYYEPAGPNEFQVRLYPSGVIELAYRKVSERDGIVGLFHGARARGGVLGAATDDSGDVSRADVDIVSAELVDNGSTMIASVTMAADIPDRVSSGRLSFRIYLHFGGADTRKWSVGVGAAGRTTWGFGPSPGVVGYTVQGRTLEMMIPKTAWPLLPEDRTASWHMTAIWWGPDESEFDRLYGEPVHLGESSDRDLSSRTGTVAGNVFEVFHYPSVTQESRTVSSSIYGRVPAEDELAAVFTDFRFDDLFNTGPATGPVNISVLGIGRDNPGDGSEYGSDSLLSALSGSRYIGGPRWVESGVENDYEFHSHSYGVRHVAHELIHRWTAHLRFRDPRSGRIERLSGDGCRCHWSEWLHVPERYPVWSGFANEPYSTGSVMGGGVWQDNGDGTFTKQDTGYPRAMGLSDLDLYAMGMIPPEEVRPTFLLSDAVETGTRGVFRATKVPVRIEDIVAAMGPRVPAASEQRRVFRLGVYLLHEDGRAPRAEWLARAQSLTKDVVNYFTLATGGGAEYFPDYVDGGGWSVQLVLSNVDPDAAAEAVVEVYGEDGEAIQDLFGSERTLQIPPLGSRVLKSAGAGPVRRGWIEVETDSGSVSGLLTYRHAQSGIEVGVKTVELGEQFALYVEESPMVGSGVAVFKTTAAPRVEFRLRDGEGADPLAGAFVPWGDFHQAAHTLPEWFGVGGVDTGFLRDFRGLLFLKTEGNAAVAPLGLRFGKGISSLSAVPAIRIHSPERRDSDLVFPDYVDGGGWSVQLVLSNVDPDAAAEAVVEVYGQDGEAIRDLFDSEPTLQIPPLGSRILKSSGAGSIRRGWVQVRTPSSSVSGLLTYRQARTGIEVSVEPVALGNQFALYVEESEAIGAGLALFKPDASPSVELRLRDEAGKDPLGNVYVPWGNFHQRARTLPEWFNVAGVDAEFLKDFRGLLFLRTADGSLFAPLGLRFGKTGHSLSAVPAIRIPEGGGIDGGQAPPRR